MYCWKCLLLTLESVNQVWKRLMMTGHGPRVFPCVCRHFYVKGVHFLPGKGGVCACVIMGTSQMVNLLPYHTFPSSFQHSTTTLLVMTFFIRYLYREYGNAWEEKKLDGNEPFFRFWSSEYASLPSSSVIGLKNNINLFPYSPALWPLYCSVNWMMLHILYWREKVMYGFHWLQPFFTRIINKYDEGSDEEDKKNVTAL